ncbi:MAG: hypothetical protein Q9218_003291, partial [Villophora microphyllina]
MKLLSGPNVFAPCALRLLALCLFASTLTALPRPETKLLKAKPSFGRTQPLHNNAQIVRHPQRLARRAPVNWPTSGWQPGESPGPAPVPRIPMKLLHFQAIAAILPIQPAAQALEKFFAEIAEAATHEWSRTPRIPGFTYQSDEYGFQFAMAAVGDTIPWDLVAEMASRLWECAAMGMPYLLDMAYSSPNGNIMFQISLRLTEAALSSLGSSNSFRWSTDSNGLPGGDLLQGVREGSVESVNSNLQNTPATPADNVDSLFQQNASPLVINGSSIDPTVGIPNPHFSMAIFRTNVRLDTLPLLMISMGALAEIALQDSTARSRILRFRSSTFDTVKITVVPKGAAPDFSYEVAALCIYYGIEELASRFEYLESTFSCKWDRFEVARVDVDKVSPYTPLDSNNNLTSPNTTTTTTNSSLTADITPRIDFLPSSSRLSAEATLLTLMNAFLRFSTLPKTSLVPKSTIDPGARWESYFTFAGDGPPATRPP